MALDALDEGTTEGAHNEGEPLKILLRPLRFYEDEIGPTRQLATQLARLNPA